MLEKSPREGLHAIAEYISPDEVAARAIARTASARTEQGQLLGAVEKELLALTALHALTAQDTDPHDVVRTREAIGSWLEARWQPSQVDLRHTLGTARQFLGRRPDLIAAIDAFLAAAFKAFIASLPHTAARADGTRPRRTAEEAR